MHGADEHSEKKKILSWYSYPLQVRRLHCKGICTIDGGGAEGLKSISVEPPVYVPVGFMKG